jgi:delta24-sterol reductase
MIQTQDVAHEQKVDTIIAQVKRFYDKKEQLRIFHGNTNTTRSVSKDPDKLVDLSGLNTIIEINQSERYMVIEPNVSMDRLVDAALVYGLVPPVIPEFPSITAGGAVQGGAAESSSFKYGGFHDACSEYEIILGDGTKVTASAEENTDLFYGITSSYGSIGIITRLKLHLIPATKKIRVKYHRVSSYSQAVEIIKVLSIKESVDFVDGIMYSKNEGLIMEGRFENNETLPQATLHKATDDWFYLHAQKNASKQDGYEEMLATKDYLFRYDRGAFWVAKHGFTMFHVPFTRFNRWRFSSLFKTKRLYKFLHGARLSQSYLVQDICLPSTNVSEFMEYNEQQFQIWPLWLCPLKVATKDFLSPNYLHTDLVINVGIWGKLDEKYQQFVERNQKFEQEVTLLGGRKVLYAHAYYTNIDFWNIYDKTKYERLRKKYNAEVVLPDLYSKTHVSEKYDPSIIRGLKQLLKP